MEPVFDFNSIEVRQLANGNITKIEFKKHSKSDEFKAAWNKALDLAIEHQSHHWLMDQRNQSIFPKDQQWVEKEWFPKTLEHLPLDPKRPRYVALVQSKNFFVDFSAKKFIEQNSFPGFEVNIFSEVADAEAWLRDAAKLKQAS